MPKEPGKCKWCGKEFESWPSQKQEYCSRSCKALQSGLDRRTGVRPPRNMEKRKTGQIDKCRNCGVEFYRKKWQITKGIALTCSKACDTEWASRNQVTKTCEWCGKPFTRSQSMAKKTRFCCWDCQVEGGCKTAIDRWHNGRRARRDNDGYILIYEPTHPAAYDAGWILEHRWVVEQALGRYLDPKEHVHHINEQKSDNRIENLAVLTPVEHQSITSRSFHAKRRAELTELEEYRRKFGPLE